MLNLVDEAQGLEFAFDQKPQVYEYPEMIDHMKNEHVPLEKVYTCPLKCI